MVKTSIKKYTFDTTIKGNLSNPKVRVDTKAFLKNKYGKKVKEKTDKFKKKIEEKLKNKIDLNNLFNKAPSNPSKPENNENNGNNKEIAEAFNKLFGN